MQRKIIAFTKLSDIFFKETHNDNKSKSVEIAKGLFFSRAKNHKWMNDVVKELIGSSNEPFAILNVDRHHDAYSQITKDNSLDCGNWVNAVGQLLNLNPNVVQLYPEWFIDWNVVESREPKYYGFHFMDNSVSTVVDKLLKLNMPTVVTVDYDYFILKYDYLINGTRSRSAGIAIEKIPSWDYGSPVRTLYRDSREHCGAYDNNQVNMEVIKLFDGLKQLPLNQLRAINVTTSNDGFGSTYIDDSRLESLETIFLQNLEKYLEWRALQ